MERWDERLASGRIERGFFANVLGVDRNVSRHAPPTLQGSSAQPPAPEKSWEADDMPDMLKNASKELMQAEEITLEKLKEIFDRASFSTEIIHAENLLQVTDANGGLTAVMADPFSGVFMVMNTFQFKTGTPELQKLKFVNNFNVSGGGMITASTKLEVDNALALSHIRYIPQGISEWSILFSFVMFKEGVAQEFTKLKALEILQ